MLKPKISIACPMHDMKDGNFFAARLTKSIEKQTYKDFEFVYTREGKMAENTNAAIKKSKGEIIKIMYMDDYFNTETALQHIADAFEKGTKWTVSGCVHNDGHSVGRPHFPMWNEGIFAGINTLGSPSILAFLNDDPLLFDERMSWMLDLDLYRRLYERYGEPTIIHHLDIGIGVGDHQMTHILTDQEKAAEVQLFHEK